MIVEHARPKRRPITAPDSPRAIPTAISSRSASDKFRVDRLRSQERRPPLCMIHRITVRTSQPIAPATSSWVSPAAIRRSRSSRSLGLNRRPCSPRPRFATTISSQSPPASQPAKQRPIETAHKKTDSHPGRRFTKEFKADAVALVLDGDRPIAHVADDLGIGATSLGNWVRQARVDRGERPGLTTDERAELARLRREVKQLRVERELLKRATAFWVKESGQ